MVDIMEENIWKSDADGHWHECDCRTKTDEAAHTPGAAAIATTAQTCTECGYELAPATGETDSATSDSDSDTDSDTDVKESDNDESDVTEDNNSNYILLVQYIPFGKIVKKYAEFIA